ncbi:xylan 1,4-beta-xylosidase [Salana multivorans]|uniref:Xylan 1,4-beta-xylosidase n=1 Tax=Salana multivorans TaxID=120377 RepID=A0A3N2DB23_9MICO|nr:xylan 1,4-beta-xylosidase [Salana multivorans]ROR96999.1 xylan 1,4-beta-xylosidase [Salana multivorans]
MSPTTPTHPGVVDATAPARRVLTDAWRSCIGTGRTREVLHADYRDSLRVAQQEIGFRYARAHGILHDDMGVVTRYDRDGRSGLHLSFGYVDQVIDTWLDAGVRPFLELGFMPHALASGPDTVFWWRGNITPPREESEWVELVQGLLRHLVARYGIDEVRTWPVEVWNEPNLSVFWKDADEAAYHRLYEITARAVKDVDADLPVGGPAISPGSDEWLPRFAEMVAARDVPCDFVSKHAYTSGPAEHLPVWGVNQTLRAPEHLLEQFATPRDLLAGTALAGLPLHITEFSSSYRPDNAIHDTAYQAAYLAPVLLRGDAHAASFSYWTLCDVFEEVGIPTSILHGGFGLLGHRQLRKPVFHLYAFLARLGADVLAEGPDHVVTRRPDGSLAILAWQPQDGVTWHTGGHRVRLALTGLPGRVSLVERHVDDERGNVRAAWRAIGSPPEPTPAQLDDLHALSEPVLTSRGVTTAGGALDLDLAVGAHGIALVEVAAAPDLRLPWDDDARLLGGAGDAGEVAGS